MALHLCVSCSRHIRVTEASCPFCGALGREDGPRPFSRATRAAMVFGSAALVIGGVACTTDTYDPNTVSTAYGAPPTDASADSATTEPDAGGIVAAYGAPPPDGGIAKDASAKDATGD